MGFDSKFKNKLKMEEIIKDFVIKLVKNENFDLFFNSFASEYLNLKAANKIKEKNYLILEKFFDQLNIVPKFDNKGNIIFEEKNSKRCFFEKRKNNNRNTNDCSNIQQLIEDILTSFNTF